MDVELDMFSGRTNPRWTLGRAEAIALADRLRNLPLRSDTQRTEPPGLGYRGFVVHNDALEFGLPRQLRVYRGITDLTTTGEAAQYDDAHGAEMFLSEQARELSYSTMLDRFRRNSP
jgi:hypothetical protein